MICHRFTYICHWCHFYWRWYIDDAARMTFNTYWCTLSRQGFILILSCSLLIHIIIDLMTLNAAHTMFELSGRDWDDICRRTLPWCHHWSIATLRWARRRWFDEPFGDAPSLTILSLDVSIRLRQANNILSHYFYHADDRLPFSVSASLKRRLYTRAWRAIFIW